MTTTLVGKARFRRLEQLGQGAYVWLNKDGAEASVGECLGVMAVYKDKPYVIPLGGPQAFKLLAIDPLTGHGRQIAWAGLELEIPGDLEIRAETPIQSAPTGQAKAGRLSFTTAGCFIQVLAPNGGPRQLNVSTWVVGDYDMPDFATDRWSLVAVSKGRPDNVVADFSTVG